MKIIKGLIILLLVMFIVIIDVTGVSSKNLVNTDYIHSFEHDINNLIDGDEGTFFVLPDFTNYLEFKLEDYKKIRNIKFVFDDVLNNYEYKIYSSDDGYRYNEVEFKKKIVDDNTEIAKVSIDDQFIKIRVVSSESEDFVHIKEISFLDEKDVRINNIEIEKEEPEINEVVYEESKKDYKEAIEGLISRILGEEYIKFFDVLLLPNDKGYDYFRLSSNEGKIVIEGNNSNSLAIALNYYFEHYLNQTFARFGSGKLKVVLPMPQIEGVVEKIVDIKYRYNYNYVAYGYTMAYWDFEDWEREIDWMALNGFNVALNLVGHEEVIRRFLKEFGFSFSEIVNYLTSPIYLPWMYMGNISRIGGELTPDWFEDRAELSMMIQNRMKEFEISPIHQTYIGYFPFKENSGLEILQGGYWSKIKGPDRVNFNNNDYETLAKVFYEKQREVLGKTQYFAGDLFHEGSNSYGYDVKYVSKKVLDTLKKNESDNSIWMIQSWGHNPSSESIAHLDKENVIIVDLHSQLNIKWKGTSKFNGMSWENKEFDSSNWIFGILNNFGGRGGLYGHARHTINEFYEAKDNAQFLVGIGHTSEAVGYNDFIDELATELIFQDKIDIDEFVNRYVTNRYGGYSDKLVEGFYILLDTVYNATTETYHEGASESIINARPSMNVTNSSKWGSIHKNYNSDILEKALSIYFSVYDEFKYNEFYINDLIDIASQVIVNLSYDYYEDIKKVYEENNFEELKILKDKFLYLINLQANILSYNDNKSLSKMINDIEKFGYDDYFKDTLKYNKKTILTTWYDKLVSEDDGLRDYANTDFYELIGNLYYNRWKNYFDEILLQENVDNSGDKYDTYRFDLNWVYDDKSLEFNKSNKSLKELIELVIVDASAKKSKFSFLANIIYAISSLFR